TNTTNTQTITLTEADTFTALAGIENYVLSGAGASTITVGALNQNVTEDGTTEQANTIVFGSGIYTGTFTNFDAADTYEVVNGSNLAAVVGLDAGILDFQDGNNVGVTLDAAQNGTLTATNTTNTQTITLTEADTFTALAGIENYVLAAGANSVTTGAANQTINANNLLDGEVLTMAGTHDVSVSLVAGDLTSTSTGKVIVTATTGTNIIITGAGDDTITGGGGIDTLTGGSGADLFSLTGINSSGDRDVVTDFSVSDDKVGLDVDFTGANTAANSNAAFTSHAYTLKTGGNINTQDYRMELSQSAQDIIELTGLNVDDGDLSLANDGSELLKMFRTIEGNTVGSVLALEFSEANPNDPVNTYLVAYDNGKAYQYLASSGDKWVNASEISLVATFDSIAPDTLSGNNFLMVV
ncbi:hypothetical protein MXB90_13700, partial [Phaeovulum sp. NW3]|nr:hypothetical protein [Phaeovulum sp. NW3]